MGQIKISQLTPKDAPLSDTDLFVIAQETPDGFESRSITGHEVLATAQTGMQPTLVSGESIKTINGNSLLGSGNIALSTNPRTLANLNGSNLTGTANQISASVLIPAGTLVENNTIHIRSMVTKTAGTTGGQVRLYINTTNSLTGATQIATGAAQNSNNYIQQFWRSFFFDGSSLYLYSPGNPISTDLTQGPLTYYTLNPANDYYLLFAIQNSTTTPDNLGHKRVIVQIYD